MRFYLGTHEPHWLGTLDVPLCVSAIRLRLRCKRKLPRATAGWLLDSGGFSELNATGRWSVGARRYAAEVRRWRDDVGMLDGAAVQDWMCEDLVLRKTGYDIPAHQAFTTNSYLALMGLDGALPWVPVLQGYAEADYLRHADDTERALGFPLSRLPWVGVGSVCRRQSKDVTAAVGIIRSLAARGYRLHGFGFKTTGLLACADALASADSLAWSYAERCRSNAARRESRRLARTPSLFGCGPAVAAKTRSSDPAAALAWRESLLSRLAAAHRE